MKHQEVVQVGMKPDGLPVNKALDWANHPVKGPGRHCETEGKKLKDVSSPIDLEGQIAVEEPCHGHVIVGVLQVYRAAPQWAHNA